MVNLPKVPRRLITTEDPRTRVSAEAVGAPFAMLGRALGDFGQGVEDVGVRLAIEEAPRAVVTGEDGMPKFEPMPAFMGRAGEAYNRAGAAKWAAEMQNKVEDVVMQARLDHRGDPEKFKLWGQGYIDQLVAKEPDEKLKDIIKAQATNQVQQHYRALSVEKQNLDIDNTKTTLLVRQQTLENRMVALARAGGVDTDEYKAAFADYQQIEQELTKNPLFKYPAEVAQNIRARMASEHIVEAAIGQMDGVFNKKGKDEARRYLEGIAWRPDLNLTDEQRTKLVSRGLSRLEGMTAENAARLDAFRAEVAQTAQNWKNGIEVNPSAFESMISRAREVGDAKSELQLRAAYLENSTLRQFRAMPDAMKPQFFRDLNANLNLSPTQRGVKAKIEAEAVAQGIDPAVAVMVAYRESRLDPSAISKADARGVFQLMKQQRQQFGVADDADADTQVKAGIASLKARITDMTNRLGREPNASEVYLAHFQGAQGAETLLKANPEASLKATLDAAQPKWRGKNGETWGDAVLAANSWMKAYPTVGGFLQRIQQMTGDATARTDATLAANPYIEAARANVAGVITKEMSTGVSDMVSSFIEATKKRNAVNEDELNTLIDWIQITGKFDAGKKLAEHLSAHENGRLIASLPKAKRDAVLADLQRKAETTGLTRAEALVQEAVENQVKIGTEQLAANPHTEAQRQGIVAAAPNYLDVASPDEITKALPQRVANARAIQSHNPTHGPVPALDAAEIERLVPVLTQGDPQAAAAILERLHQGTTPEMFAQTVAQPAFKTALEGMVRSGDTTRMGAAFSALDVAYRTNPQQFEVTFGKALYSKMAVWQSNLSYLPPERIADILRKADDPATSKVRGEVVTQMRAEGMKLADADVLNAFGTNFLGITWSSAQPNVDPVQAGVFKAEFAELYAELRAGGVDQENALKRAVEWQSRVWGVSAANGNRLMRRPPEAYLPQVYGSHAWVKAEIETEIERVLGPQYTVAGRGLKAMQDAGVPNPLAAVASPIPKWQYALVADPKTEGEIARFNQWKAANPGKTPPADLWPSYQLFVFDGEKREIDLWERGPDMTTEPMPLSAPAQQRPRGQMRFRWSDTATRARQADFEALRPYLEAPALDLTGAMR